MNAGDTYELDVFRNWQAIEGFMNAKIALPDAHYEVVDFDGKPSDVVSIAPNAVSYTHLTLPTIRLV